MPSLSVPAADHIWVLKRNCALTPRCAALACLGPALLGLLIALGWWALGGQGLFMVFALLQAGGMAAAFVAYSRRAADRETVRLHAGRLDVEQRTGEQVRRTSLPAASVQVRPEPDGPLIALSAEGRSVRVGCHLRADQRRSFVRELRQALQQVSVR